MKRKAKIGIFVNADKPRAGEALNILADLAEKVFLIHRRDAFRADAALVSRLTAEIIKRGKVPFYCSAWSNIRSARTAVSSGFYPAWAELTVKPRVAADKYNE